jgi:hypothetical protein
MLHRQVVVGVLAPLVVLGAGPCRESSVPQIVPAGGRSALAARRRCWQRLQLQLFASLGMTAELPLQ